MDATSFAAFLKTVLLNKSNELEALLKAFNYTNGDFLTPKIHAEQNKLLLHIVESLPTLVEQSMQRNASVRPNFCTSMNAAVMDTFLEEDSE